VIASGREKIGEVKRVIGVPWDAVEGARRKIKEMLQRAVEDMKVSAAPVTVVGGGSILFMDELEGVTR
jgi:hypothetical protein